MRGRNYFRLGIVSLIFLAAFMIERNLVSRADMAKSSEMMVESIPDSNIVKDILAWIKEIMSFVSATIGFSMWLKNRRKK